MSGHLSEHIDLPLAIINLPLEFITHLLQFFVHFNVAVENFMLLFDLVLQIHEFINLEVLC